MCYYNYVALAVLPCGFLFLSFVLQDRGAFFMGITPLTLGLASLRGTEISDHKSGQMVRVQNLWEGEKPLFEFVLLYKSGFTCRIRWQNGQGFPGYCDGVIPFVQNGCYKETGETPRTCLLL